jgi:NADH-quinone oxidoreductase subunit G
MAELVALTIDGIRASVPKGTLIVDAAKRAGVDIPVFCYHPKLTPAGMCRMCLVEVGRLQRDRVTGQPVLDEKGQPKVAFGPKLETACTTPVEEGMAVVTTGEKVHAAHRDIIEFILTSHPLDCPVCDKGGECPLQNLTLRHGLGTSRFAFEEKQHLAKHVPLGDLIFLDRERCIQCGRCVRFQKEIVDDPVIGFYERGRQLQIVTVSEPGFNSQWSGNTTDICPVGALTTADFRFGARPWELDSVASICPLCPVGCNLTFSVRREAQSGGKCVIKRVVPRQNEAVNEIWLCNRGRFGYHFIESPSRLTQPLIRQGGELKAATWEAALALVGEKFRAAASRLVALAGGGLTNEGLYASRKLALQMGGKAELDSSMGGGEAVQQAGIGVGTNLAALGKEAAILVVASDLENDAPVWWLRVKQAADRGATVITINARPTRLDRYARFALRCAAGAEAATVQTLAAGASEAAQAWGKAENAIILFGNAGLDFSASSALARVCADLVKQSKRLAQANTGLIAVWPQNNMQGAWDLGLTPSGRPLAEVVQGAEAVWLLGVDPVGAAAMGGRRLTPEALPGFVVVQDQVLTETASRRADVVLPSAAWAECDGTFTSGERRVQRFYAAVPPQGKADFQIAAELGARLGVELPAQAAEVMQEIARTVPAYHDVTYARLAQVETQWPIVGDRDLYFGGTAHKNEHGLGLQLRAAPDRGKAPASQAKRNA